jgi:probable HAF family extracellular repeat protein
MMQAKANLFRTLLVLPVVVLVAVAALFGLGLKTAETQTTTPKMQVQDLGTLGGSRSVANSINDSGQVVGSSDTPRDGGQHAFLYDGTMQDLGTLGSSYSDANSINDSGQVVGSSYTSNGEQNAFLYDESATPKMQGLNDLIPADSGWTGYLNEATGINSDGKIAAHGEKYSSGYMTTAFVLTPATTATYEVQNLGYLGGDYGYGTFSTGINDPGQVLGKSYNSIGASHTFLYDESATPKMQDLGSLDTNSINDSGQVVGNYLIYIYPYAINDGWRAYLYDSATQQGQALGTLGGYSDATGINDSGQVVGNSYVYGYGDHAFLKESGQSMIDLNTLIPADSGWTIREARAINSDGKIAATGYKAGAGAHALLLTPTSPIPPADTQAPSAPTITSPQNNTYDSDGSVSVSGSAEAASTVELFEGTTSKGTKKADSSSGAWSIALSGVSEGAHTYSAKAKDAAGNTSSASTSLTVTVDKTAPKVSTLNAISFTSTGVPLRKTDFKATFSEKMAPNSLRDPVTQVSTTFKLFKCSSTTSTTCTTQITAPVTPSADGLSATLNPFGSKTTSLQATTRYMVVVTTSAKDVAGNALDQDSSTTGNQQKVGYFTTGSS